MSIRTVVYRSCDIGSTPEKRISFRILIIGREQLGVDVALFRNPVEIII